MKTVIFLALFGLAVTGFANALVDNVTAKHVAHVDRLSSI